MQYQGLYSISGKTSYRQISWSLEAARLDVAMVVSLWNLTGIPAKFQSDWKSLNPNLAAWFTLDPFNVNPLFPSI